MRDTEPGAGRAGAAGGKLGLKGSLRVLHAAEPSQATPRASCAAARSSALSAAPREGVVVVVVAAVAVGSVGGKAASASAEAGSEVAEQIAGLGAL